MEIEMDTDSPLRAHRDIIMEMIFNLIMSIQPEDSNGFSTDTENRVMEIYHELSYSLKLPPEESI